jgi:hypothetical protein
MFKFSLKFVLFIVFIVAVGIFVFDRIFHSKPIGFPHEMADFEESFTSVQLGYSSNDTDFAIDVPVVPQGPYWAQRNVHPPFSASEAIRLAIKERKKSVKGDKWKLRSCALIPWFADDGYWYWEIRFIWNDNVEKEFGVIVLMDGSVLPHTATPF